MDTRQWPKVKWDYDALKRVAESLMIINNPFNFSCAETLELYIIGISERELYRHDRPCDTATGGWQVVFIPAYSHLQEQYDYIAIVSVTPYTLHRYLQEKK
jgi:hypothetical protein